MTALASRIERPSSLIRSKHSFATFAQSSLSCSVTALRVCLSASLGFQGIIFSGVSRLTPRLGAQCLTVVELCVVVISQRFANDYAALFLERKRKLQCDCKLLMYSAVFRLNRAVCIDVMHRLIGIKTRQREDQGFNRVNAAWLRRMMCRDGADCLKPIGRYKRRVLAERSAQPEAMSTSHPLLIASGAYKV